jgi:curli biogenesis system outer membrane secretion channel CsgG
MSTLLRVTGNIAALTVLLLGAPVFAQVSAPSSPGIESIKARTSTRVAVLNFDFSNLGLTGAVYTLGGNGGPSLAVSTLLTNQLVKDGTYVVIERSRIDAVLAEQNLGQAGRLEPTTAAQVGRILGVDAVIIGSVTQFGLEQKKGGFSFGGVGSKSSKQTATVQLAARMVSTTTGEILAIAEGKGMADEKEESFSYGGIGVNNESNASDRLLAAASEKALAQMTTQLVAAAPKLAALPPVLPLVEPVVADVAGGQITFNKGGKDGLKPGMILQVERVGRVVRDPNTGKVLTKQTTPLGRVQLVQVKPDFSIGKVLRGQGFKVGDVAKAVE